MKSLAFLVAVVGGAIAQTTQQVTTIVYSNPRIDTRTVPFDPFATTTLKCNADNCARAVTGTARGPLMAGLSACSSYQRCTVSPGTSSVTVTTTTTPQATSAVAVTTAAAAKRDGDAGPLEARAAETTAPVNTCNAKQPPAAASKACGTDGTRYRSACACAGVTQYTTSSLAPVKTVSTVTTTPTTDIGPDICFLSIRQTRGEAACGCNYSVQCGYATCGLSQLVTVDEGPYAVDQCINACDARADCRGFTLRTYGSNACSLCLSDDRSVVYNGTYSYGYRQSGNSCSNSRCNLPAR